MHVSEFLKNIHFCSRIAHHIRCCITMIHRHTRMIGYVQFTLFTVSFRSSCTAYCKNQFYVQQYFVLIRDFDMRRHCGNFKKFEIKTRRSNSPFRSVINHYLCQFLFCSGENGRWRTLDWCWACCHCSSTRGLKRYIAFFFNLVFILICVNKHYSDLLFYVRLCFQVKVKKVKYWVFQNLALHLLRSNVATKFSTPWHGMFLARAPLIDSYL